MGLARVFEKAVDINFRVFNEAVKSATLEVTTDNGFDEPTTESYSIRVLLDKFTQKDISKLRFADKIQPTDTKGLVPGKEIKNTVGEPETGMIVRTDDNEFTVKGFDVDPYNALYTLLLRDTK